MARNNGIFIRKVMQKLAQILARLLLRRCKHHVLFLFILLLELLSTAPTSQEGYYRGRAEEYIL